MIFYSCVAGGTSVIILWYVDVVFQARNSNTGTMRMKRALLCRAGEALAPDAFILVLDSESETKG